jgi:hypothetical protein
MTLKLLFLNLFYDLFSIISGSLSWIPSLSVISMVRLGGWFGGSLHRLQILFNESRNSTHYSFSSLFIRNWILYFLLCWSCNQIRIVLIIKRVNISGIGIQKLMILWNVIKLWFIVGIIGYKRKTICWNLVFHLYLSIINLVLNSHTYNILN